MRMAGAAAKAAGRVEAQCATAAIPNRTSGTMTPRALLLGESRCKINLFCLDHQSAALCFLFHENDLEDVFGRLRSPTPVKKEIPRA